jgi:hypothetical protein
MPTMTSDPDSKALSDVCLLLRAHAEQGWLNHELLPVLRELQERQALAEEELGAALAYLEVLWIEAAQRAADTEAARADLDAAITSLDPGLSREARSYYIAVCALRDSLARHVMRLLAIPEDAFNQGPTQGPTRT